MAETRCWHVLNISGTLQGNVVIPDIEFNSLLTNNIACRLYQFHISIGCQISEDVCPNNVHTAVAFDKSYDTKINENVFVVDNMTYGIRDSFYKLEFTISDPFTSYIKQETLEVCKTKQTRGRVLLLL